MLNDETKEGFLDSAWKVDENNNNLNNIYESPEQSQITKKINNAPKNYISLNNKVSNKKKKINEKLMNMNGYDISVKNNNIYHSPKNSEMNICTCTKSQCQKNYCSCYSSGNYCKGCDCKGCLNIPREGYNNGIQNDENIDVNNIRLKEINAPQGNINKNNNSHIIECNCTKSKCLKKYCECYKAGVKCGNLCRCFECQNINKENINDNIANNIQNNDIKNERIKELKENCQSYCINAMGISIYKKKLFIEERNIDIKENINSTPKLSSRKRNRSKNGSSNLRTYCTTVNSSRRKEKGLPPVNSFVKNKKLIID